MIQMKSLSNENEMDNLASNGSNDDDDDEGMD